MRKKQADALGRPDAATFAHQPRLPLLLVADNVRSMHNIGAFFRTADAFALQGILLCGISACPPHRDIYKAALGAEQTVPWRYEQDVVLAVAGLRDRGYTIALLEQTDASLPLAAYRPPQGHQPLALVVGNEVQGVSESLLPLAHLALEIPQWGTKHSLNVSVAAGIALYTLAAALRG
ncbi:MAG: TrmH family RNA methyltransferase [Bacteroidetes bacterium]|jgi:23S rRNA (guanosine2251-2'-O)-methyltransferase|nr:TrmH family RNA methyltransferase [Bacteroidota bacterium]